MKKNVIKLEKLEVKSFTTDSLKHVKGGDVWTEMKTDGCSADIVCTGGSITIIDPGF